MFSSLGISESSSRDRMKRIGADGNKYTVSDGNKAPRISSNPEDMMRGKYERGEESRYARQIEKLTEAIHESDIRASRLRAEIRNDKNNIDISLQDLRNILSDEVATRKKSIQKASNAFDKLNSLAAKTDKDLIILAHEVEDRFLGIDATIHKVATQFSDQLLSLQYSTKHAVKTLQSDHKAVVHTLTQMETHQKEHYDHLHIHLSTCTDRIKTIEEQISSQEDTDRSTLQHALQRIAHLEQQYHPPPPHYQSDQRDPPLQDVLTSHQQTLQDRMDMYRTDMMNRITTESMARESAINHMESRLRDWMRTELSLLVSLSGSGQSDVPENRARLDRMVERMATVESNMKSLEDRLTHMIQWDLHRETEERQHVMNMLENRLKEVMRTGQSEYDRQLVLLDEKMRKNHDVVTSDLSQTKTSIQEASQLQYATCSRDISNVRDTLASEMINRQADWNKYDGDIRQYLGAELSKISSTVNMTMEMIQEDLMKHRNDMMHMETSLKHYVDAQLCNITGDIHTLDTRLDESQSIHDMDRGSGGGSVASVPCDQMEFAPEDNSIRGSMEEVSVRLSEIESHLGRVEGTVSDGFLKETALRYDNMKAVSVVTSNAATVLPDDVLGPIREEVKELSLILGGLQISLEEMRGERGQDIARIEEGLSQCTIQLEHVENDIKEANTHWVDMNMRLSSVETANHSNCLPPSVKPLSPGNAIQQQHEEETIVETDIPDVGDSSRVDCTLSQADIQSALEAMQASLTEQESARQIDIANLREIVDAVGLQSRNDVAATRDDINILKAKVDELQNVIAGLQHCEPPVGAVAGAEESDNPQLHQIEAHVSELKSTISTLQDTQNDRHAKISAEISQHTEGILARQQEFHVAVEELQETINEMKAREETLRANMLADVTRQTEGAVTRLVQMNKQMEQMQADFSELRSGADTLRATVKADVGRQTEGAIVRLKQLGTQMEELQSTVTSLQEKQDELRCSVLADVGRQTEGAINRLKILSTQAEQFDRTLKQLLASQGQGGSPAISVSGQAPSDVASRLQAVEAAVAAIQNGVEGFRTSITADIGRKIEGIVTQLHSLGLEMEVMQAEVTELKEGQGTLRASIVADVGRQTEGAVALMKKLTTEVQQLRVIVSASQGSKKPIDSDGAYEENIGGQDNNYLMNLCIGSPRESSLDDDPAVDDNDPIVCTYCGKRGVDGTDEWLDMHYWKECPLLVPCQACNEIVEIGSLNTHLLGECTKKDSYQSCYTTGLAIKKNIFQQWSKGPDCKSPPPNCIFCPLCLDAVEYSTEAWKEHHIRYCSANLRRIS